MRRPRRILLGLLAVLAPLAWAACTTSGLRAVLALAGQLTHGAIVAGSVEGRLAGEMRVQDLRIDAGRTQVTVAAGTLDLALVPLLSGRLHARQLSLDGLAVRVAPVDLPSPAPAEEGRALTVTAPFPIELAGARVRDFTLELPTGLWRLPEAELSVRWTGARFELAPLSAVTEELGALAIEGRFGIEGDALLCEPLRLRLQAGGDLEVEGRYAFRETEASDLALRWHDLRPPRPEVMPGFTSARGAATLRGARTDWRWTLDAEAVADATPLVVQGRGTGSARSVRAESLRIAALGGTAELDGMLAWAPALAAQLHARWSGLNPARRWPGWPGVLNGEGQAEIRRTGAGWQVAFDAGLRESKLRGYPLSLQARGVREGAGLQLARFELRSGASVLEARGRLLPQLAVEGTLRSADLASLWAGLAGNADLSLAARGPWEAPRLSAHGSGGGLTWGGIGIANLRVDAEVAPAGHSDITLAAREAHGSGAVLRADSLVLHASGTQRRHSATLAVQAGAARGRVALAGGRAGSGWRGRLDALELQPAQGGAWSLEEPAALALARGTLELEPACLRNAGSRACAEFQSGTGQQHLALRLRAFELGALAAWLPRGFALRGTLDGTGSARLKGGELSAIAADLRGSAGEVTVAGTTLAFDAGALTIEPDENRLHARLTLRPAGGTVDGEVWLAPGGVLLDRPMLGTLDVDLPALDWLPVFSAEIESAHGSARAALHVSGSLRSPSLDGRVDIRDGRVALTTPGIELTQLTAAFERGRDAPLKMDVSAVSGGGRLVLAGELVTLQPRATGRFTLKGESVLGYDTPDLRAWVSPDLALALDGRSVKLTGTVVVPRADITPRRGERGGIGPSGDAIIVADEPHGTGGLALESDVRIVLGDEVRFDGRGLKTRLTGALTARDVPGWPTTGHGELRLVGGRYQAYGQDLTIETGRLVFPGGPITEPAIDLSAYREVNEDVRVGLRARGTLAKPEFGLYSTPAMSQEEQLSYLVLGRPMSTTLNPGQRSQLNGAAVSLGLTGGDYIAQQLAPKLGLDEVSVESKPGETTDLARFTIGKYLSPRLFLSYGVGLFQPGQFVKLTYDLSRRFKLSGESGTTQGGDLLYTIER